MKTIMADDLNKLGAQAAQSPRLRANYNIHSDLADPIQRLVIAMQPGTYIRPHRHPHTWELLYAMRGRFLVLHFDDVGMVIRRTILGEDCKVLETAAGDWHAVLSLDEGAVIFEVKHGPYTPISENDYAAWSQPDGTEEAAQLLAWYPVAAIGGSFSARKL